MGKVKVKTEDFLKMTFTTRMGGCIKVLYSNGMKRCLERYIIHCSICSLDTELWPEGSIQSSKWRLLKGVMPCGCATNTAYTESQYLVLIRRRCEELGYEFHGFFGEFKNSTTRLKLVRKLTGTYCDNVNITDFLNTNHIPRADWNKSIKDYKAKSVATHLQDFYLAGFTKDFTIWRDESVDGKIPNIWYYKCPECSNDEYVRGGVCSGVFKTRLGKLKKGSKACRCSGKYKWTEEQRELKIKQILDGYGGRFKGWHGGYKNSDSRLMWECGEGHDCVTTVNAFVNSGHRCSQCSRLDKPLAEGFGFYPERFQQDDYLYCVLFEGDGYIKVGRSFDPLYRITKGLTSKSGVKIENMKILKIFKGTHYNVYKTEQDLHKELTDRGFYHKGSKWTVESFDADCIQILNILLMISGLTEIDLEGLYASSS